MRSDFHCIYTKRARFSEIDAQGVLFNARHIEYFDIGNAEYWRAVGRFKNMSVDSDLNFHVIKISCEYRRPIHLDEQIDICVRCQRIGTSSLSMVYELHSAGKEDLRSHGEATHVHVDRVLKKATAVPQSSIELLEKYERRPLKA